MDCFSVTAHDRCCQPLGVSTGSPPEHTVSSRAQGSGPCDVVTQRVGALGFGVGQTWVQVVS